MVEDMRMTMRRLGRVLGLAAVMVMLSAPVGLVQAALVWQIETVDSVDNEGLVGTYSSLALDASGQPHISYSDIASADLKYAVFDGNAWQIETVDAAGDLGGHTSLALDGGGLPHISYFDDTSEMLKYARYTGTDWQIETVDTEGTIVPFTSLAIDASGLPHISFHDGGDSTLKYAHYTGTDWQIETVDSSEAFGAYTSLALDGDGVPHISYWDAINTDLKYAVLTSTGWQTETVDSDGAGGATSSLAIDASGLPHISYSEFFTAPNNGNLRYAHYTGTAWQIETVDSAGFVGPFTSLALDGDDQPHISYWDAINGGLKYAHFTGTDWAIETVDSDGEVGLYNSLALDADNQPHISYADITNNALKYASGQPVNEAPTVGAGGPYTGAEGSPITLDGAVSDPENDTLTTAWSYTIDSADPDTTCTFGDPSQIDTTVTCTDDGTVTLTLSADDGLNDPATATATVTISNATPTVSLGDDVTINTGDLFTATGNVNDPGTNDTHTATVDYGDGAGEQTLTLNLDGSFNLSHTYLDPGQYTVQVCVSDDDAGQGCDQLVVQVVNRPPAVAAGGPYSGAEGSPITLDGTVSDPENDALTTTWSYVINSADSGISCAFGDSSQVDTTFTCTDDGAFTVTLAADDGTNPAVTATATVTISNAAPTITEATATLAGSQVTINMTATDPGANDPLNYTFDCDNDSTYEVDAGTTPSTTCPLNPQQEGTFTYGIQVSDDDGGIATDTVTVTVATELCANNYTGVLRYSADCRGHETAVTIPGAEPVTVCASVHNGLLRAPANGLCAGHETTYVLPEDGPLNVCVSNYTQTMRVVNSLAQCASHEYGRVIAATEIGGPLPPRAR